MKGEKIRVGYDGFVQLVDYMGDDNRIAQAARVSYGDGTKKVHSNDGLIRYLMRHHHTSPFEQCELQFLVRVPMDIWRQWIRHRTANVNEYSTRYSVAIDQAALTGSERWRLQKPDNKQGSDGYLEHSKGGIWLTQKEEEFHKTARELYEERLKLGVAREQARKDLPLSTYTEAYWKIDLHNLFHFLRLRLDPHAQLEIREYAQALSKFVCQIFPVAWGAFLDYRLQAMTLTRLDQIVIRDILAGEEIEAVIEAVFPNQREGRECLQKLRSLGFIT